MAPALVQITNAPAALDPLSPKTLLSTLAKPNLIRNIAGLKASSELARAALEHAAKSATTAGSQSSQSLAKAMEATSQVIQQVLDVSGDVGSLIASTGLGLAGGSSIPGLGSGSSSSFLGGLLNQGKKLDLQRKESKSRGETGDGANGGETPSQGADGAAMFSSFGGGSLPEARTARTFEETAFLSSLGGWFTINWGTGTHFEMNSFYSANDLSGEVLLHDAIVIDASDDRPEKIELVSD